MASNVIFSSPTYGMGYPSAFNSHIAAIMNAGRRGLAEWHGVASPDRVGVVDARNFVANIARDNGHGVVWADADTVIEVDGISKLLIQGKDFVTAIGFQRQPPHMAMVGRFIKRKGKVVSQWIGSWPEANVLAPMESTGFSLVYTSHALLNKLGEDPFSRTEGLSEDLSFCWRAKMAGVQLYVDTGISTYHLMDPIGVGKAYAQKHWAENDVMGKVMEVTE